MFLLMSGLIKETIDNACHQINQSIEEAQEDYIQYNGVVISTKVFGTT